MPISIFIYVYIHLGNVVKPPANLAMKQIEKRLQNLSSFAKDAQARTGWIAYMRQAMSMTLSTLGKAAGLAPATVQQIEKREAAGKVTIETMRKIAAAMVQICLRHYSQAGATRTPQTESRGQGNPNRSRS